MFFLLRIVFGNPLSTIIIAPIEYQSDNWWLEVSVSSVVDCVHCVALVVDSFSHPTENHFGTTIVCHV